MARSYHRTLLRTSCSTLQLPCRCSYLTAVPNRSPAASESHPETSRSSLQVRKIHVAVSHLRRFPRLRLDLRNGRLTETGLRDDEADAATGPTPAGEAASDGLQALRRWTSAARSQRREVEKMLLRAKAKHASLLDRQRRRTRNPLWRLLSGDRSGDLRRVTEAQADIRILEGWLDASSIELVFEPKELVLQSYAELTSAFAGLQHSAAAWHLSSAADCGASPGTLPSLERGAARLELGEGNVVQFGAQTLKIRATDGPAITFYPGMLMTVGADGSRDLLGLRDVQVTARVVHVAESDIVPADARIVKNSPNPSSTKFGDPSLHHDHRLPICAYARLAVHGPGGIIAEYQFSNAEAGEHFAEIFKRYQARVFAL